MKIMAVTNYPISGVSWKYFLYKRSAYLTLIKTLYSVSSIGSSTNTLLTMQGHFIYNLFSCRMGISKPTENVLNPKIDVM